jgi:4-hydroxyphenylacetate 3-monooxygenase
MGRTPDYKAAFSNTLGGFPEYCGTFADNARNWYKRAQEAVPFMNHAIVNPLIDRHRPAEAVKDVYACVKKETDAGIFVSGAKVVATSAAMTHYNFMGQSSKAATEDPDMSVMFMVPINAPGLKLVCRASYEYAAGRSGSPFDYPLSSRFDENDAIFIMDNVFIPWEDVFVYRETLRGS